MSFKTQRIRRTIRQICVEWGEVVHRNNRGLHHQEENSIQVVSVQVVIIDRLQAHLHMRTTGGVGPTGLGSIGGQRAFVRVIVPIHLESLGLLLRGNTIICVAPDQLLIVKVLDPVLNLMNGDRVARNPARIPHTTITGDTIKQKRQIGILRVPITV